MLSLKRAIQLGICAVILLFALISLAKKHQYTLDDLSHYLDSLNKKASNGDEHLLQQGTLRAVDKSAQETILQHRIEAQVNELLNTRLEQELRVERDELASQQRQLETATKEAAERSHRLEEENAALKDLVEKQKAVKVQRENFVGTEPAFTVRTWTLRYKQEASEVTEGQDAAELLTIDGDQNELVVLSSFTSSFGTPERTYKDFINMIATIEDIPHFQTSLSFLISKQAQFEEISGYLEEYFANLEQQNDGNVLRGAFSKITIMNADFIEKEFKIGRDARHEPQFQKKRRRLLARLRNFLIGFGIKNEKYSLSLDNDILELPPQGFLNKFIRDDKDIATTRVDIKIPGGMHFDYDLNAWAGDRRVPNSEEDAKLDVDPKFVFEPQPGPNSIHLYDLATAPEKYGIDSSQDASFELKSVGGALLFVKSIIYKQGSIHPPLYIIGTKWEREGFDGIETEGLCFMANQIGYKCWGYPNLVAYHSI